jgi:predicted nucleic acid-binding protein
MSSVILDTGPLVAWFCPRDEHHSWARRIFMQLTPGTIICEAVLAEVCHLVAKDGVARGKVIEFVERGGLVAVCLRNELPVLRELLDRYADAPMDFADACVVRLAELHSDAMVCTTDTHFQFYRKHGREPIPLLASFAT